MAVLNNDRSLTEWKRALRRWRHARRDAYKRVVERRDRAIRIYDEYIERHRQQLEDAKALREQEADAKDDR